MPTDADRAEPAVTLFETRNFPFPAICQTTKTLRIPIRDIVQTQGEKITNELFYFGPDHGAEIEGAQKRQTNPVEMRPK